MKLKIKGMVFAFAFVAMLVVALISFAAWSCNSPAVSLDNLNRIQVGMAKADVQAILGKPDKDTKALNTPGSHWWYKNPLKWYALRIDFTADDKVIRYIHDD